MIAITQLTRRQAEKVAGVSRATLARYVADGRLSVRKDGNGYNVYDAAELHRVFPDSFDLKRLETDETGETRASAGLVSPPETEERHTRTRFAVLEVEKRHLEADRERLREEAERLRRELSLNNSSAPRLGRISGAAVAENGGAGGAVVRGWSVAEEGFGRGTPPRSSGRPRGPGRE